MAITIVDAVRTSIVMTGSTWVREDELDSYLEKNDIDKTSISYFIASKKLISCCGKDKKFYFSLPEIGKLETDICKRIMCLLFQDKATVPESVFSKLITDAEKELGIKLHEQQKNAVKMAVNNSFSIITGGPGTGKTSVLNCIYFVLKAIQKYESISFNAPTGKAARRIKESTGKNALTLHKNLKITDKNMEPTTIEAGTVIVDESSMLDLNVSCALLKGLKDRTRLILVGDIDQLPSVGMGAVLRDLIVSDVIPVTMLTKTFRQDNSSELFFNIQQIKKGLSSFRTGSDFELIEPEKNIRKQILELYIKKARKYGVRNVIILTPFNERGESSAYVLNRIIQRYVNPKGKRAYMEYGYDGEYYQQEDSVMQLVNRKECANGDVGYVIEADNQHIKVKYVDCEVVYKRNNLNELSLAYAMTIHKSQGSEYKSVITMGLKEHGDMLTRNLMYTAITRAKAECSVIATQDDLEKTIANIGTTSRITMLAPKLRAFYKLIKNRAVS